MAEQLDEELQTQAGEYVIGTLRGRKRAAFERVLADSPLLRAEVLAWEARLVGLHDTTAPVQPPQRVWLGIEDAITPPERAEHALAMDWWHSLTIWRGLAAAALLALVVVALPPLLKLPPQGEVPPVVNLVVRDAERQPLWMLSADWRTRELAVTPVAGTAAAIGKSHELWWLPVDDGVPLSLGLLDGDERRTVLPAGAEWRRSKAFAVSLEPAGGSPTGVPTGPVLYVTPIVI